MSAAVAQQLAVAAGRATTMSAGRRPPDDAGGRARRPLRVRRAGRADLAVGRARAVRRDLATAYAAHRARRDQLRALLATAGASRSRPSRRTSCRPPLRHARPGRRRAALELERACADDVRRGWWRTPSATSAGWAVERPDTTQRSASSPSGEVPRSSPEPVSTRTADEPGPGPCEGASRLWGPV